MHDNARIAFAFAKEKLQEEGFNPLWRSKYCMDRLEKDDDGCKDCESLKACRLYVKLMDILKVTFNASYISGIDMSGAMSTVASSMIHKVLEEAKSEN